MLFLHPKCYSYSYSIRDPTIKWLVRVLCWPIFRRNVAGRPRRPQRECSGTVGTLRALHIGNWQLQQACKRSRDGDGDDVQQGGDGGDGGARSRPPNGSDEQRRPHCEDGADGARLVGGDRWRDDERPQQPHGLRGSSGCIAVVVVVVALYLD